MNEDINYSVVNVMSDYEVVSSKSEVEPSCEITKEQTRISDSCRVWFSSSVL